MKSGKEDGGEILTFDEDNRLICGNKCLTSARSQSPQMRHLAEFCVIKGKI
jgi:hypothetical protein